MMAGRQSVSSLNSGYPGTREHMSGKTRILIVEDEAISAMFLEMEFRNRDFDVCKPVATIDGALAAVEAEKPDVVIMDISLPGRIDGIEGARRILEKLHPRIIFITGYDDEALRTRAEKLNPAGYFVKPLSITHINQITRVIESPHDHGQG
jgi:two-component system, response regulator PdtaR